MDNARRVLSRHHDAPDAAIVIPAHNEEKNIAHTLYSVARAAFSAISEGAITGTDVIVVANVCADDTVGVAERLGARVLIEDRKGVSYARQTGLEAASAPVILGTDADTCVGIDWIGAHLRHYDSVGVVGVAGDHSYRSTHWTHGLYRLGSRATRALYASSKTLVNFSGCNASYRRDAAISSGGFSPGIDMGEDAKLGIALGKRGIVIHDHSPECAVTTSGRRFGTPRLVLRETLRKIDLLIRGDLYTEREIGGTFEDIRD